MSHVSLPDHLLLRINALERWLERAHRGRHLLPVRLLGYGALTGLLMLSNLVALLRWPVAAVIQKLRTGGSVTSPANIDTLSEPIAVDADALDDLIESGRRVLVDFWAAWCGPCIMMNESLHRVAEAYGNACVVAKVDTMKHADVAKAHRVKGLPTLVLFVDGQEVERHAGALSYQELTALIEEHSYKSRSLVTEDTP